MADVQLTAKDSGPNDGQLMKSGIRLIARGGYSVYVLSRRVERGEKDRRTRVAVQG